MGDVDVYKQEEGDRPVERSPRERYIRFDIRLGSGAYKTVYKAYDTDQGIDVAWNAIDIGVLPASEKTRIIQEVQLLQKLEHKNIINFYGSWFSKEKNQVVFITEIMTSGNLKSYIKRVQFVKWKIIKRWCIQILEGLHYLHSQHPAVIHRDLKCDNIFINGNTGDLRIGDLGLSTQLAVHKRSKAQSVLGTPEFMAPELYDESYDEKVDIYAFGMCVLEMVTKEVPYSECINPAQIYKKVTAGIRPRGLQRIVSLPAREFIELCLSRGNGQIDVSAEYLLDHPFLKAQDDDNEMVQVLDEDALERDALSAVVLPPTPEMNSKQFADELNMESGSKGRDVAAAVVSERRKTLLLEPEALATGSSMVSPPLGSGMRSETAAEEKSAGKQRVLMPPSLATTGEKDVGVNAGGGAASDSSEPIVDEPLSDKKGEENHHVDNFLSGLPPTEANIRNDRIAVMGGRGHRIEIEDVQAYADDDVVPPTTLAAQQPPAVEAPVVTTATPTLGLNLPAGATLSQNSDRSTETTNSTVSVSVSDSTTVTIEARPRANTMSRPPSASKKPRKRYDIKATKDPDNDHSILLNLRMSLDGKSKEIKFPFNLFTDNSHEVACELAVDVGILEPDLEDIADSISFLVTEGKINNMSDVDLDVWDEAPEPHSFPTKPLPHVSKLTFESAAASHAHALLTSSLEAASPAVAIAQNAGNSSLPHEAMLATDTSFTVGSPTPYERNLSPPIGIPSMVHAASESIPSSLYHPDAPTGTTMLEHSMSVDAHYMQTVRQHEDRMKLARSSYDERESSLEEAMRTQEEKHQREIERIRMKMQEFNEKTARATMARQERMRLGTDEFRDDGSDLEDDNTARPSSTPPSMVVADEMQEPVVPAPTDGCGAVTETATESLSSTASSGRSPRNTENLPATLDHAVADLSLSPAPDLSVAPPTDAPPPAPSDNGSVADS